PGGRQGLEELPAGEHPAVVHRVLLSVVARVSTHARRVSRRARDYYLRVLAETTLGALAALGSAVTWAVTGLLVRSLMADLGSVAVNALRSSVGGALLVAWVLGTRGIGPFASISAGALALLALSIVAAVTIGSNMFFECKRALSHNRAMAFSM